MKTINLKGKLSLDKKVISKLNNEQMFQIQGGATLMVSCGGTCADTCGTCFDPTCIFETCPTGAC